MSKKILTEELILKRLKKDNVTDPTEISHENRILKIKEIYDNRPNGYEVDHIIPLCSKNVSGLHIPENLQYLKAEINRKKNNKFNEIPHNINIT